MKHIDAIKADPRLRIRQLGPDGGHGQIFFNLARKEIFAVVVFSWGGGWDHVSVSFRTRCPTWNEMCVVKDIFFRDDECCVEYHPAKKDYVNVHEHCLHIWKPQDAELPMPPRIFV